MPASRLAKIKTIFQIAWCGWWLLPGMTRALASLDIARPRARGDARFRGRSISRRRKPRGGEPREGGDRRVGTELLLGQIANTNAQKISRHSRLSAWTSICHRSSATTSIGWSWSSGGDRALATSIVVTGGLGPTPDDITREAMAKLARHRARPRRSDSLETIREGRSTDRARDARGQPRAGGSSCRSDPDRAAKEQRRASTSRTTARSWSSLFPGCRGRWRRC